jgi:hypothetical protein
MNNRLVARSGGFFMGAAPTHASPLCGLGAMRNTQVEPTLGMAAVDSGGFWWADCGVQPCHTLHPLSGGVVASASQLTKAHSRVIHRKFKKEKPSCDGFF